jgi:predicted phage terminase large subunit-like protein
MLVDPLTVVTRGSTYENIANLPADFRTRIIQRYEGTRVGRQELHAEILEDVEGALWKREWIDASRMDEIPTALVRVVVAIDPAMTSNEESAETGIIVTGRGQDGRGYILDDVSLRGTPDAWAKAALRAYHRHRADAIVAEVNAGGEMVEHTIRTVEGGANVPFIMIHASRGKATRAEPMSALYEQGRVSHVGSFATLEDQMCSWVPGEVSPDRMDALVHGLTELGISEHFAPAGLVGQVSPQSESRFVRGELEGSRWGRGDESRSWHR